MGAHPRGLEGLGQPLSGRKARAPSADATKAGWAIRHLTPGLWATQAEELVIAVRVHEWSSSLTHLQTVCPT